MMLDTYKDRSYQPQFPGEQATLVHLSPSVIPCIYKYGKRSDIAPKQSA